MAMKQKVLGTALGRMLLEIRNRFEIAKIALFKEEAAGMIINDWMATFLVTKLCHSNRSFIDVGAHIGSIISEVSYYDPTLKSLLWKQCQIKH